MKAASPARTHWPTIKQTTYPRSPHASCVSLLYLLERIEPVSEKLAQLIDRASLTAEFYCYWMSATGQGGPGVSAKTLGRIARLSAELSFEFHGPWHGEIV